MRKFRIFSIPVLGMFMFIAQPSMVSADSTTTTVPVTTTTVPVTTTTTSPMMAPVFNPLRLFGFSFSPTVIDTTNSSPVISLTIQVTDAWGNRAPGNKPSILSANGCLPLIEATNWQLTAGDFKNGIWSSTVKFLQNGYCQGSFRIKSGWWAGHTAINWGIISDQSFSMINYSASPGDGCGNICPGSGSTDQNNQITTTSSSTVFIVSPKLPAYSPTSIGTSPTTIGKSPTLQSSGSTTTTSPFKAGTQPTSTRTTAPKTTTTTSIPKCSSAPNAIGGQNITCNNGINATANQNVFGGQDLYLQGTGTKLATTKPNALGGIDIFSNGKKTTVLPNVFGGNDYYSGGKKVFTTKPNAIGGITIYQGNRKVQTCTTDRKGKQTCR
jgi:hypothetical protein